MNLSKQELSKLIRYSDDFRSQCERHIRRIRRNKEMLDQRHAMYDQAFVDENGILSPDEEIDHLKTQKAEAVIIKKKLKLIKEGC